MDQQRVSPSQIPEETMIPEHGDTWGQSSCLDKWPSNSTFQVSEHSWMGNVLMMCTWALHHVLGLCVARPVPPAPGSSFQTGLQMLLAAFCYDLDPWRTGMWQRSLVSEKLSSEKFFTRKCKEGVHINGMPCTCSFFGPSKSLPLESQEKRIYLVSREKRGLGVNW